MRISTSLFTYSLELDVASSLEAEESESVLLHLCKSPFPGPPLSSSALLLAVSCAPAPSWLSLSHGQRRIRYNGMWPELRFRRVGPALQFVPCKPRRGFHPSEWPTHTPGHEFWLPPVHLVPFWGTQHGAYHGPIPAILSHFAYFEPHFGLIVRQNRDWAVSWATWLKWQVRGRFSWVQNRT